jgi:6-pyruvoyl-tetrahydropterin synthase
VAWTMNQAADKQKIEITKREALISLIALCFIEENDLLSKDQLSDAKRSLKALFLRTSGEESMLRKLIEILKSTRALQNSFANISKILVGMSKCVVTVDSKVTALRDALEQFKVSAEENKEFIGPFLSFSQELLQKMGSVAFQMQHYLEIKENEARTYSTYRIAKDARLRLKQRLSGSALATEVNGNAETKLREQIIASFDYGETERSYKYAVSESRSKAREIKAQLADIKDMCQMAMNPGMREKSDGEDRLKEVYDDMFTRFSVALENHSRLADIKGSILELFKLYQHSYGMFRLDFDNLNKAIATMIENSDAYFEAKEEDSDIQSKRDKLSKIEGLIPFLEGAAESLHDEESESYMKFSKRVSDMISRSKTPWTHIYEELLRSKVQAEAELSTRL